MWDHGIRKGFPLSFSKFQFPSCESRQFCIMRVLRFESALKICLLLILLTLIFRETSSQNAIDHSAEDKCPKNEGGTCKFLIHAVRSRDNFGAMCEERGLQIVAELGVQSGRFSDGFLYTAPSTKKYILVDTWEQRQNYSDAANVNNARQEQLYQQTMKRLGPYKHQGTELQVLRMYTTEAAKKVPDDSIDFIYVDARHDYCGVLEDIEAWWPKLKVGGIMAGDDYLTAKEQLSLKNDVYDANDDWAICSDGSRHEGAVKGAVKHFASKHGIEVYSTWKRDITNKERQAWPQWLYAPKKAQA